IGIPAALPTVSAVLVIKNADTMAAAVAALRAQTYPELEIVLGLHGLRRADALVDATRPLAVVEIPAERTAGEALSEATARAGGGLLARSDEGDRYGREHIWVLVLARQHSGATIVGKAPEFVFLARPGVTVRRTGLASEVYATRVAGGALLMSRSDLT